jgi:voltage-gated potassium channel
MAKTSHSQEEALYRRLLLSVVLFFAVFLAGALGYYLIGVGFRESQEVIDGAKNGVDIYDFTPLNALYMSAISVTTVGYGEVSNFHSIKNGGYLTETGETVGTIYTICYLILAYLAVIYASANIVAALVEGAVGKLWQRRKMEKLLASLEGHYIVCGGGDTGRHIVAELSKVGENVVVIDKHANVHVDHEGLEKVIPIQGDATSDEILEHAGVKRAKGLFACLGDDKDNLFIALTARQCNDKARIIGRATDRGNIGKLKAVGCNAVISPNHIGGLRMASEMVRPGVVTFLDTMLRATDASLRFSEVIIEAGMPAAGKTLYQINAADIVGLTIIAIYRKDKTIVYNPRDNAMVEEGDALIVIANAGDLDKLRDHVKSGHGFRKGE